MNTFNKYSSFIKIEHTLFSLPLLFAGALIAQNKWPPLRETFLILIAGASARVVALVFNRVIDRKIDAGNPRTKERHLSSGKMNIGEASFLGLACLCLYLLSAWLLSDFCLRLSWIPLIGFAAYPFFKRFTKWAHVGLGVVWSLVPAAGFFAVKPSTDGIVPVVMLGIFSIFWLAGFDIIYATLDEKFDRAAGLYSLPACWGLQRALRMAGVFHSLAFLVLVLLYGIWFSGPITVMLLVILGMLLIMEYKLSRYVDLAFFQLNTIIGFVVLFFVLAGIRGI